MRSAAAKSRGPRRSKNSGSRSSIRSPTLKAPSAANRWPCRATWAQTRCRAGRCRCAWVNTGPSCRPAPKTTSKSPSSPDCGPGRRWTPSPSTRRCTCSSCRAPWVRPPKATRSAPRSASSAPTSSTAPSTCRSKMTTPTPSPSSGPWRSSPPSSWSMPTGSSTTLAWTTSSCSTAAMARTSPTSCAMHASPKTATPSR